MTPEPNSTKCCIVPARGGSQRLPGKNLKLLDGKPLIFHTLDAVLDSEIFDKIIFTSDSEDALALVKDNYPSSSIFIDKRSAELSSNTSKVIDTVMHYFYDAVFDTLEGGYVYDQVWLTLPTCPLRTPRDLIGASNSLTPNIDSVLSITDVEFPPTLSLSKDSKNFISSTDPSKPWENGNSRSQDHPVKYRPNGALYGMWSKKLEIFENFYTINTKGFYMPRERSIDIDTEFDFQIAEELLKSRVP